MTDNIDLFETPEQIPSEIKVILDRYKDSDNTYDICEELIGELELEGFTCDYDLSGTVYDLRKIT